MIIFKVKDFINYVLITHNHTNIHRIRGFFFFGWLVLVLLKWLLPHAWYHTTLLSPKFLLSPPTPSLSDAYSLFQALIHPKTISLRKVTSKIISVLNSLFTQQWCKAPESYPLTTIMFARFWLLRQVNICKITCILQY